MLVMLHQRACFELNFSLFDSYWHKYKYFPNKSIKNHNKRNKIQYYSSNILNKSLIYKLWKSGFSL